MNWLVKCRCGSTQLEYGELESGEWGFTCAACGQQFLAAEAEFAPLKRGVRP